MREELKNRGVCVIIPTYNNAGTIVDVVRRCQMECDDVIVVCDGCTDATPSLLRQLENAPCILEFPSNRGKGAALKEGFRYALKRGFAYAVTIDADGQHYPQDIPLLLERSRLYPRSIIIGERQDLKIAERSSASKFANAFANFWFTVQTLYRVNDTQSGYRMYPLNHLHGLSFLTSRYEAELELLVFSAWHGIRPECCPVRVYYPPAKERVSHFRPVKDFTRISILNTILCLLALVYGFPMRAAISIASRARYVHIGLRIINSALFKLSPQIRRISRGEKNALDRDSLHKLLMERAGKVMERGRLPSLTFDTSNLYGETFSTPAVIICNHQSLLDLIPLIALHDKLVVMTTRWVYESFIFGNIVKNLDFLPVADGYASMMPRIKKLVSEGYSIAIFPEGTRSFDGRILRFHKGAFALAEELRLDIVTAFIHGSALALPKGMLKVFPAHIHFQITERIPYECIASRFGGEDIRTQASLMRKHYIRRLEEISDRLDRYE